MVDEYRGAAENHDAGAAVKGGTALIVGAGSGLSAALAHAFAAEGLRCVLAARRTEKLQALCGEIGATRIQCNKIGRAHV